MSATILASTETPEAKIFAATSMLNDAAGRIEEEITRLSTHDLEPTEPLINFLLDEYVALQGLRSILSGE